MNEGRNSPTLLLDETPSTIDGLLPRRHESAVTIADPNSEQPAVATQTLARLLGQGHEVYLTPQNFIEFWAVATRPVEANGFGWTSERTTKEVADLQERFPLLPDTPEVFNRWLELVHRLPIRGKRVHDARLVAVLQTHAIEHLITFNPADFIAFPFVSLIDPHHVGAKPKE
jgi:predicted nucleic acid-binding protein